MAIESPLQSAFAPSCQQERPFFRAEVERRKDEANAPGIIYAIEEPETSQHSENQKKLVRALIALSAESNVQVISDWYTTSWFAHKNGGSSPWESATSHGNFALGNTGSGLGPFGLGSTTAVLYSNYDASSIQRGDVVQLGRSANDIRHSVIVRTAGSSFENIFVNSHNSKHYNYPLSKYFETYSYIRVIHYRPAFFAN